MADRIAVMNRGRIEQVAPPIEIYDRPATLFVSQFVGTSNLLPGKIAAVDGERAAVALADGTRLACVSTMANPVGSEVLVSVRPERLRVHTAPTEGAIPATVKVVLPLGPIVVYEAETRAGEPVKISAPREGEARPFDPGDAIFIEPAAPDAARLFQRIAHIN